MRVCVMLAVLCIHTGLQAIQLPQADLLFET